MAETFFGILEGFGIDPVALALASKLMVQGMFGIMVVMAVISGIVSCITKIKR
ncbi:MAG: hypothetical protein IJF53_06220 [Clostridia bacterium]|nr:hypothetical protein [Clostridia bacterium]